MRWSVEIQKTSLEARNLSDLFDGLGYELVDGIDYPAIASPTFEDLDRKEQVWSAAQKLRDAFRGPAAIDPSLVLGSVIDYSFDPPKRSAFLEVDSAIHIVFSTHATLTVAEPKGLSDDELRAWKKRRVEQVYQDKLDSQLALLAPVLSEPNAEEVIAILKLDNYDGVTVYRAYELMEGHPSGRKSFHEKFGVTAAEFARFKDAVHNRTVSGNKARHTYKQKLNSTNPMTIAQAEAFVRRLSIKWLASLRHR